MSVERFTRARNYLFSAGLGPLFVRSIAGTSFVRILAMLASFGVGVQLARGLGAEGYGYYGLALSILTIASIPGELGLPRLVTREVARSAAKRDYSELFGVMRWAEKVCWLLSAIISAFVAAAAAVLISRGSTQLGLTLLCGIPVIAFMALSKIRGGALQGLHFVTLGQVPEGLLRPCFFALLLFGAFIVHRLTPPIAMALNSVSALMILVVAQIWLRQRQPAVPAPAPASASVKSHAGWLKSAIPLALTDGMRVMQVELTTLLLGLMSAADQVGLFRIAVVTAAIAAVPMTIVGQATMSMMARLFAEDDMNRLQKVVTYSAWIQTAGVVALSMPLLIAPKFLLSLVFGSSFAPAATAMRVISIAQILNAAFGSNALLLNMTHHEKRVTRAMAIGLLVNVVTVPALLWKWGIVGAAFGFLCSLLFWNVLTWLDARRLLGIETSVLPPSTRKAAG